MTYFRRKIILQKAICRHKTFYKLQAFYGKATNRFIIGLLCTAFIAGSRFFPPFCAEQKQNWLCNSLGFMSLIAGFWIRSQGIIHWISGGRSGTNTTPY
jgi:hypothetical protein